MRTHQLAAPLAVVLLLAVVAGTAGPAAADGEGPLVSFGANTYGARGDGTGAGASPPGNVLTTGVLAGKTIAQVSAGGYHACAVTTDGMLACWGRNDDGQVGDGTTTDARVPVAVTGGSLAGVQVTQVAAGSYHTCALDAGGRMSCWGYNGNGALGNGGTANSAVPVTITPGALTGHGITELSAGYGTTCAVADGGAYCWGSNSVGQVGDNTVVNRLTPVAVDAAPPSALAGRVVRDVVAGVSTTCATSDGGALACWGLDDYGQLGVPGTTACTPASSRHCSTRPLLVADGAGAGSGALSGHAVARVAVGYAQTCVVTTDGSAICWGHNNAGQVGNASLLDQPTPALVDTGPTSGLAGRLVSDIAVSTTGSGLSLGQAGSACARTTDGSLACWGSDDKSQLGVPPPSWSPCADGCADIPIMVTGDPAAGLLRTATVASVALGRDFGLALSAAAPVRSPGAPIGVSAVPADSAATVTWSPPADPGTAPLAAYDLQRSTDGGATWSASGSTTPPVATLAVTGLANGVAVSFRVRATSAAGTGPWSAPSAAVVPTASPGPGPIVTVPGPPTAVLAQPGNARATVTWTAPASTGGAPVLDYAVQLSTVPGTWANASGSPVTATNTALDVTGLANDTPVTFRVAARNSIGTGAWSTPSVPVTPRATATVPGPVRMLTARSARRGQIAVTWWQPATGPVLGYQYRLRKGAGSWSDWRMVTKHWVTVNRLSRGAVYAFAVRARNAAGLGPTVSTSVRVHR